LTDEGRRSAFVPAAQKSFFNMNLDRVKID